MKSSPSLLLELCVCGAPIFRHRLLNGRQITCEALRCIDERFFQSGAQPVRQADRQFQIIAGGREATGGDA